MTDKKYFQSILNSFKDAIYPIRSTVKHIEKTPALRGALNKAVGGTFGGPVAVKLHYLLKENGTRSNFCAICGEPTKFKSFKDGYSKYCSQKCSSNSSSVQSKMKATNKKNFGEEKVRLFGPDGRKRVSLNSPSKEDRLYRGY